jgi:hypothetical protein
MNRKFYASFGALHPFFFMVMVYIISVVLAFFVCTTIYNSIHGDETLADGNEPKIESMTALK